MARFDPVCGQEHRERFRQLVIDQKLQAA
jgi:hypothetical protein